MTESFCTKNDLLTLACPACGKRIGVHAKQLGHTFVCPLCKHTLLLASPPSPQVDADSGSRTASPAPASRVSTNGKMGWFALGGGALLLLIAVVVLVVVLVDRNNRISLAMLRESFRENSDAMTHTGKVITVSGTVTEGTYIDGEVFVMVDGARVFFTPGQIPGVRDRGFRSAQIRIGDLHDVIQADALSARELPSPFRRGNRIVL